jgi:hypothetical protein
MATRLFTDLLPKVLPSVPGCPQPLAIQHIRDAAIRVCERTLAWRYIQPKFTLLPGVHEYLYDKPIDSEVHVLFGTIMNDSPLEGLTLEQAIAKYPEWADLYSGESPSVVWSMTPSGAYNGFDYNDGLFNDNVAYVPPEAAVAKASEPRSVTQLTPDKYIILPLPDAAKTYALRMFYALKPSRTAAGMEAAIMTDLEDAIVHNTLQQLLVMPQVAWTDRELASYHAKQFLYEVTSRRARANLGAMRGTMVVSAPKFA